MSYQVLTTCYATALAAAQASASSQIGSVVSLGSSLYVVDVQAASDTSITYKLNALDTTATVIKTVSYTPMPCGLLDTADGLFISGSIATAWIIAAAINHLREGVHT